jgi:hypothetical protein
MPSDSAMPDSPNKYCVDKLTVCLSRASMAVLTFTVIVMAAGGSVFDLLSRPSHDAGTVHSVSESTSAVAPSTTAAVPARREEYRWHDGLEATFFVTGIGLFISGIYGLLIAKRHADHVHKYAEATAQATEAMLHRLLFDKLESKEVRDGLAICGVIAKDYDSLGDRWPAPLSAYAVEQLKIWQLEDKETMVKVLEFLDDLEEIGLSVRRGYFLLDDVYDMFEGPLRQIDAVLGLYLEEMQDGSQERNRCEHTRWLLNKRRGVYTRTRPLAQ